GDQIVIPNKTDLIQVGGEVMMPQAVVYNKNASLEDYVAWAGGYTDRANDKRIAVVHANGLMEFKDGGDVMPGDQILVMPKVVRELKTRFGSYRLGYTWALLDPLLMIGAFSLIFGMRGHSGFGGAPAPLFITASYLPFLFFRNVVSKLQSAVNANKGLFCYRQVTPFATFVSLVLMPSPATL
ncbi:SLBB domain-containing protein, partial [Escherichia coli]|uniref:SLBB domain-containing protein n=1 Tax=Escherichia coli TaxID=562 RepID=UPI001F49F363